jgi:hypothetical protein
MAGCTSLLAENTKYNALAILVNALFEKSLKAVE